MESVPTRQFERRKLDHIELALKAENEAQGGSGLDRIQLIHEALPDLNFSEISLGTRAVGISQPTPLLISSMTAGHPGGGMLNIRLAQAAERRGWLMGVGSQRRELEDQNWAEWAQLRKVAPRARLLGNIGLSQVITSAPHQIQKLADQLEAVAMIVHTNPLQECLQPEGTPEFRGGLQALEKLCRALPIPVILKEVGCGFSRETLTRIRDVGLRAVDVSGYGGTHWGRIEGKRSLQGSSKASMAETFANWGLSTVDCMVEAKELDLPFQVWASGGVRSGLDVAKLLALGARIVGMAKPVLSAALESEERLDEFMERIESELKIALFCTGCGDVEQMGEKRLWQWQKG